MGPRVPYKLGALGRRLVSLLHNTPQSGHEKHLPRYKINITRKHNLQRVTQQTPTLDVGTSIRSLIVISLAKLLTGVCITTLNPPEFAL